MQYNQSGRTMVEMIGVLGIIGLLSVGGIVAYSQAMMNYKVNHTVEQVSEIASRITLLGEQATSYNGLNNDVAIKMKAVPGDMINIGSSELDNMFNGYVYIESANLFDSEAENSKDLAFTVTYTGLDSEACVRLAMQNWKSGKNGSLMGVAFAPTEALKDDISNKISLNCTNSSSASGAGAYVVGCADKLPLPADEALKGCGCDGETCIMIVKYN